MILCTACRAPLPTGDLATSGSVPCPSCRKTLHVELFPALWRSETPLDAKERAVLEEETRCFFHEAKPAVRPCDLCGRFLCSLCDLEIDSRHLCPRCVESGKAKGKLTSLENRRVLWDAIALSLAIIPALFIWPSLLSAPVVLFLVIRHWRSPGSILPRSKARFVAAGLIAIVQIVGWMLVAVALTGD